MRAVFYPPSEDCCVQPAADKKLGAVAKNTAGFWLVGHGAGFSVKRSATEKRKRHN